MQYSNIKGFEELEKALSEFPQKLFKNALRRALYAGVKVIAKEAKVMCPVAPPSHAAAKYGAVQGELRRSIRYGTKFDKATGKAYGYVKAGATDKNLAPFYAHFVEFGTAAHLIFPRNGTGALALGDRVFAKVSHPGATPHPFMRPAMDAKQYEAIEAMRVSLADSIQKNMKV